MADTKQTMGAAPVQPATDSGTTLIDAMNKILATEYAAITQYVVHAQMLELRGYPKLAGVRMGHAKTEMNHAHDLLERIIFIGGTPEVKPSEIKIGKTPEEQVNFDYDAEVAAIKAYNEAIECAVEVCDNDSRRLLEDILHDEEDHLEYLAAQKHLIEDLGKVNWLQAQV